MKIDDTLTLGYEYSEPRSVMMAVAKRQLERLAPQFDRIRIAVALTLAKRRIAR
ncbi:hypothetical protein [Williamsia sterculiae]|uniref:Uncharacterized protein n=1 Tax=Williamsia sterculiae TaxID=1344003 RepID=A0A1N7GHN1_9NOCA|nr:hypothetical protein [Williamsia sterculiae]SIS12093.1 hypothetical protein SAMN05445060_2802 [Williamsia sterculiae]